ncbi:hypothetical protein HNE_1544 [Hyphomonas neptunium ATCC 15444]|uniref:Uncharacterized protein n=1 Tax=Hyphomonas neptunium (strain ATCC 15444) TaxID=228405 RepID=Q0C1Y8_HYPNA|nr:hypothetical protein HNE_1544 [Hyphomonas neptunium ATCC 15444]
MVQLSEHAAYGFDDDAPCPAMEMENQPRPFGVIIRLCFTS